MNRLYIPLLIGYLSSICCACLEIRPLTVPVAPICQPPAIEQNIIGTWHFSTGIRNGIITFSANRAIDDPDSLFDNRFDIGGQVLMKLYDIKQLNTSPTTTQETVLIRQITRNGEYGTYYTIRANECKKIQLSVTNGDKVGFTLTR